SRRSAIENQNRASWIRNAENAEFHGQIAETITIEVAPCHGHVLGERKSHKATEYGVGAGELVRKKHLRRLHSKQAAAGGGTEEYVERSNGTAVVNHARSHDGEIRSRVAAEVAGSQRPAEMSAILNGGALKYRRTSWSRTSQAIGRRSP